MQTLNNTVEYAPYEPNINLNISFYNENDLKNQSLQQNLSDEQIAILNQAGDDSSLMNAPSAYQETYSENRILYKKESINSQEVYVYSNDPNEELYSVRLSLNQSCIPALDTGVKPSFDNLSTAPLCLSVKYVLNDSLANDSGFLDIP